MFEKLLAAVRNEFQGLSAPTLLAVMLINLALTGVIIPVVWKWFVTPLGAPTINWSQAIGLSALARAFFSTERRLPESAAHQLGSVLGKWSFILALAWIAHSFT
jgi:hypothetical protein